jgi:hypothetical protein
MILTAASIAITVSSPVADAKSPIFYLDVGASASLGVQPTGITGHNGAFTRWGYGDDLVRLEAARGYTVSLTKVGCMGETAQSMLRGDHCYAPPTTQLTMAVAFLRAHHADHGIVTVDIGFNNIRPCLWVVPLAGSCAEAGIAAVKSDLPGVLRALKSAAGPHVHLVGLDYADPFLYRYLKAPPGPTRAMQSVTYLSQLNAVLIAAYRAHGIPVADVAAAFKTGNLTSTTLAPYGAVPVEVAEVCKLTWICASRPFGPDDHPNKAGYLVIAQTIVGVLPRNP